MSDREFEPVGGETVFEGPIFTVRRERFRFTDDGEVASRDIVRSPGAVGIVAHDGEHVVLVRQPREATGGDLLELPAGRLDHDGERPEETAARELEEEVGLRATSYELLTSYFSTAGMTDEKVWLYLATGLEEIDDPASSGENERITVERHRLDALDELLPTIEDAKTLIGLLLLRDRLRG